MRAGTVADVRLRIDNFDTVYLGDTTVSPEASLPPNVKGRGARTDLHVAMTRDPALQIVENNPRHNTKLLVKPC